MEDVDSHEFSLTLIYRRFGFANPEALAAGETGTACRGEEHDVTLVWSVNSGKRLILADGQEVHYSSSRNGIFDFSWTMRGNHVLKIVAHASPPMAPTPGWRQYDFFVDGQSFFTFPKVYRLGLAAGDPRGNARSPARLAERGQRYKGAPPRSEIASLEAPTNPQEEEAYLQAAINESMKAAQDMKPPTNASGDYGDLLDFGSVAPDPVHNQAPPAALPPSTNAQPAGAYPPQQQPGAYPPQQPPAAATMDPFSAYGAPPQTSNAVVPAPAAPYGGYAAPAPPVQQNGASPYGVPPGPYGAAQPPQPAPNGVAPINTQQPNLSQPVAATPQATQQPATPTTNGFQSPPVANGDLGLATPVPEAAKPEAENPAAEAEAAKPALTMNSLTGQEGLLGDGKAQGSGSMADQAYARMAAMDSFTLGAKPQNPFEAATGVNNNVVGGNTTLADIQAKKDTSSGKKEIMKSVPAPAGAMVPSGNQNGNWGMQQQTPMGGAYGQPQMGMQQPYGGGMYGQQQPAMGNGMMQQQPAMGMQPPQMNGGAYGQQPQMGQPGQYPPPLNQPFGAPAYPPATQG